MKKMLRCVRRRTECRGTTRVEKPSSTGSASLRNNSGIRTFTLLPMDFYYPGTGRTGDLPPRKGFADRWHPPLLALMSEFRLTLLIGRYAQTPYLPTPRHHTLTDAVRHYTHYLPELFPLVHPSPLNFRWHAKNPWFRAEVLPELRTHIHNALEDSI